MFNLLSNAVNATLNSKFFHDLLVNCAFLTENKSIGISTFSFVAKLLLLVSMILFYIRLNKNLYFKSTFLLVIFLQIMVIMQIYNNMDTFGFYIFLEATAIYTYIILTLVFYFRFKKSKAVPANSFVIASNMFSLLLDSSWFEMKEQIIAQGLGTQSSLEDTTQLRGVAINLFSANRLLLFSIIVFFLIAFSSVVMLLIKYIHVRSERKKFESDVEHMWDLDSSEWDMNSKFRRPDTTVLQSKEDKRTKEEFEKDRDAEWERIEKKREKILKSMIEERLAEENNSKFKNLLIKIKNYFKNLYNKDDDDFDLDIQ